MWLLAINYLSYAQARANLSPAESLEASGRTVTPACAGRQICYFRFRLHERDRRRGNCRRDGDQHHHSAMEGNSRATADAEASYGKRSQSLYDWLCERNRQRSINTGQTNTSTNTGIAGLELEQHNGRR